MLGHVPRRADTPHAGNLRGEDLRVEIERLLSAGRLAEAAPLLETTGDYDEAARLYEKLWDFAAAARVAQTAGDLPRALTNVLRGRDQAALDEILAAASAAPKRTATRCAEVLEGRNMLQQAAVLREQLGDQAAAAALYERAGLELEAARLREEAGDLRRALSLYRKYLAEMRGDAKGAPAELALGRLLLRHGRPGEAISLLQAAADHATELALPATRAAAVALHRAGYPHAARVTLELFSEAHGESGRSLDDCLDDPRLAAIEADDDAKTVLAGRYRLGELLGSGGMGRVYAAIDLLSGEQVAVKVFTAPGGARGRDAYKRFVREARSTGGLDHPHIVKLRDFNEELGFMVLEYMAGGTLGERLRPRLSVPACRSIALQIVDALAAAHQRGIVHRDLKPSNIFFTAVGAAKLGDFGVAHLSDSGQTQTGAFIGTLAFMSPEQIRGDGVSFATDIYALGVTLFLMLTGRLPFEPPELVDKHLNAEAPAPSTLVSDLPEICDAVLERCLVKDPAQRFESLAALRQQLERFPSRGSDDRPATAGDDQPPPERPRGDTRFTVEALRFTHPALELREARDNQLARSVMLVRIAPGRLAEPIEALLKAGADADAHLQRVLSLGPERGDAVLELPAGSALELPWRGDPLDLCAQIATALAPLHGRGLAHGALRPGALLEQDGYAQLSLTAALLERIERNDRGMPAPPLASDLLALGQLTALDLPPLGNATELLAWIRRERQESAERARKDRLARALSTAPPGVNRS